MTNTSLDLLVSPRCRVEFVSKGSFGCQGLRKTRNIRSPVAVSFGYGMAKEIVKELGNEASWIGNESCLRT